MTKKILVPIDVPGIVDTGSAEVQGGLTVVGETNLTGDAYLTGDVSNVTGAFFADGTAEFGSTVKLHQDPTLALQAATKQYVDNKVAVGGGTDEVWVGTADPRPTNPTIELWYDSDAPTTPTTPNPLDEVFIGPVDPHTLYPSVELWYDESDNSSSVVSTPYGGTPPPIAAAGAPGVSPLWARGDHTHARNSEIFHTEITADVSITATTPAAGQTVVNSGAVAFDGSPIMIEFYTPALIPPLVANAQIVLNLWDGAVDLGYIAQCYNPAANNMMTPITVHRRLTPTVGSHTYNIRAWVSSGTGTVRAGLGTGAGVFFPAFLRATRI